jgi:hypothetical protein
VSADVAAIVERLCGTTVATVEPVRAGGNNELFRVRTREGVVALKRYPAPAVDPRNRLDREFGALGFLRAAGERAVPRAIARDASANCAVYEWIEGERVATFGAIEIDEALAFLARTHASRGRADAATLPDAEEAALDGAALVAQIAARGARYAKLAEEPALQAFLRDELAPLWQRLEAQVAAVTAIAPDRRTLSPSDFGVHNTLRRSDATLAFVDFEYFGWDDPVKLAADTLWHPGSAFDDAARERVRAGLTALYGADDPAFVPRLAVLEPAYGVRWALIVLAEFTPERWARRTAAGDPGAWDAAKHRQLAKARSYVERSAALVSHRRKY